MKEKLLLAIGITLAMLSLQDWSTPMHLRNSLQPEAISHHLARLHSEALP